MPDILVVYFSNVSENTARFVQKLGVRSIRIPVSGQTIKVTEPYILVVPTYGSGRGTRMLPPQVSRFLSDAENRAGIRGVIGSGNTNFGSDYCKAGDLISAKCKVPHLHRFELIGMPADVEAVKQIIKEYSK